MPSLRTGEVLRRPGGGFLVVLRAGARPLALPAASAEPTSLALELNANDLDGVAAPLFVTLEETVAAEGEACGRVLERAMARLLKRRIALDVELFSKVAHAP
ncbi:MAG TPA: hypothetical protein VMV18_05535, partial [bacterium]|nr:hypothetical protein [bacterium]